MMSLQFLLSSFLSLTSERLPQKNVPAGSRLRLTSPFLHSAALRRLLGPRRVTGPVSPAAPPSGANRSKCHNGNRSRAVQTHTRARLNVKICVHNSHHVKAKMQQNRKSRNVVLRSQSIFAHLMIIIVYMHDIISLLSRLVLICLHKIFYLFLRWNIKGDICRFPCPYFHSFITYFLCLNTSTL